MNNETKRLLFYFIFQIIILCIYNYFYNIDFIDVYKCEYLISVNSEDGKYTLNGYLRNGDSLSADSHVVEIVNNKNGFRRNIYNHYPVSSSTELKMEWINSDTILINGKEINIYFESYYWQRG